MITASCREFKDAYSRHYHAYRNWGATGSTSSKRLVLTYCVECGLKFLYLRSLRVSSTSEVQPHLSGNIKTHDIQRLLRNLNEAGNYHFPSISTINGDSVGPGTYHQLCRYCVRPTTHHQTLTDQYENILVMIADWLQERC